MATKVARILTPRGMVKNIAQTQKVCTVTVIRALSGEYAMTRKALRIRKMAIESGGVETRTN
jgi:hypothetical protein